MSSNHLRTDLKTFQALDALPPPLFRAVCFAARVWDATDIMAIYNDNLRHRPAPAVIDWLDASIQAGDEEDLRRFGQVFRAKYKRPLPHLGAEATILRFTEPGGTKLRRAPRALPREVRAAWQASERLLPKVAQ